MSEHTLDARGLLCPMPVIRTQGRVAELSGGDLLHVLCTDPGALQDIPAWCRVHGHELIGHDEIDSALRITVRVGGTNV